MLFGYGFVMELVNMNKSLPLFNRLVDDIKAYGKIIFPKKTFVLD